MTSYTKTMMESLAEVRGLQENNMDLMRKAAGGAMQTLKMKDGKLQMDSFTASAIMQVFDKVNPANQKKMEQMINDGKKSGIIKLQKFAMSKVNAEYSEELELDEGGMKRQLMKVSDFITTLINQGGMDKSDYEAARGYVEDGDMKGLAYMVNKLDTEPRDMIINAVAKGMGKKEAEKIFKVRILRVEEVELDEGKMKELHGYIQDGKSAKEIAKIMKLDVKTIKALMSGYNEAYELGTDEYREYLEKLTPGEMDEASARADAMRGMRRGREVDPADVDTDATDDDVKAASKNIIMQMRKAVSLSGAGDPKRRFKVEFGDGKKVKIPAKVAQAVQDKYNSLKKPADKEKFQAQVAKSYKDMLKVLKAGYMMKAAYEEVELDEATGKEIAAKMMKDKSMKAFASKVAKMKTVSRDDLEKMLPDYVAGAAITKLFEEVELDEGKAKYTRKLMKNKSIVDYVKKQQEKNRKDVAKFGNKKVGASGNEPRFDSGSGWLDMASDEVKQNRMSDDKRRAFDADAEYEAIARKLGLHKFEPKLEEVEIEEASAQVLAHGGKGQYKVISGPAKDGSRETVVKFKGKVVSRGDFDSGADGWFMNIKGKKGQEFFDSAQKMADYFAKNKIKEEVELDEVILKDRDYEYDEKEGVVKISKKNFAKVRKDAKGTDKSKPTMMVLTKKGTSLVPVKFTEEVELDESEFDAMAYGKKDQRFVVKPRDTRGMAGKQDKFKMYVVKIDNRGNEIKVIKDLGSHSSIAGAKKFAANRGIIKEKTILERIDRKLKERKNG